MRPFRLIGPVMLCLAAACSSSQGLRIESLNELLDQEATRFAAGRSTKPEHPASTSKIPPTLGLYVKPTGFLQREFEWTDEDRDYVLNWANQLATRGVVAKAAFVSPPSLKGPTFAELQATAARQGMDALLVLDGAAAVDRYNNYKALLLYWTILGAYLADGTHSDALCLVKATLWDATTGNDLLSERSEAMTRRVGPAAFVRDGEEVDRARRLALDKLLRLLAERLEAGAGMRR